MCLKANNDYNRIMGKHPRLIAVTGGIGSGKSVICRMLEVKGFRVYDCDSEARRLMEREPAILNRIASEICRDGINADGSLNRRNIAEVVFSKPEMLEKLNAIVHGAVLADINRWRRANDREELLFVETAILYQSGLDRMVDEVWEVDAPEDIRISRAMLRDGAQREAVTARVKAQCFVPERRHPLVSVIINDGSHPVLPRINSLLQSCEIADS